MASSAKSFVEFANPVDQVFLEVKVEPKSIPDFKSIHVPEIWCIQKEYARLPGDSDQNLRSISTWPIDVGWK